MELTAVELDWASIGVSELRRDRAVLLAMRPAYLSIRMTHESHHSRLSEPLHHARLQPQPLLDLWRRRVLLVPEHENLTDREDVQELPANVFLSPGLDELAVRRRGQLIPGPQDLERRMARDIRERRLVGAGRRRPVKGRGVRVHRVRLDGTQRA